MLAVLTCIATAHDVRFVAVAGVICCIGAFVVMALHARVTGARPLVRGGWIFLTALVAGSAIWCTHFFAMLVEGVETETELTILRAEGCERVQSYLTGRPTPEPAITAPWPLVRFATR